MSSMFLPSITIAEPSPEMLRAIAAVLEQESVVINLNRRDVMQKIQDGLNESETPDPEILPTTGTPNATATSTASPWEKGETAAALAAPAKKRGRPPKSSPDPTQPRTTAEPITVPTPVVNQTVVPVNPVVTMPNGVVLNAPAGTPQTVTAVVETPAPTAEPLVPAVVLAAYAQAFKIPAVVALAQREGVQKFTELPEARQQEVYTEMMQAVSVGVPIV